MSSTFDALTITFYARSQVRAFRMRLAYLSVRFHKARIHFGGLRRSLCSLAKAWIFSRGMPTAEGATLARLLGSAPVELRVFRIAECLAARQCGRVAFDGPVLAWIGRLGVRHVKCCRNLGSETLCYMAGAVRIAIVRPVWIRPLIARLRTVSYCVFSERPRFLMSGAHPRVVCIPCKAAASVVVHLSPLSRARAILSRA